MSLIIHRCTTCGQPDYWHDAGGRRTAGDQVDGEKVPAQRRRSCCRRSNWGPPETAPRWSTATYERITEVLQPGLVAAGVGVSAATSCNCDDCWALYRELTGSRRRHLAAVPD
jgi:hypothetical protein